jgi:hypothetical protein
MKLKDFLNELNHLIVKQPEILEFEVVYSVDDEGNAYFPVNYSPTLGIYNNLEFHTSAEASEFKLDQSIPNAICIN